MDSRVMFTSGPVIDLWLPHSIHQANCWASITSPSFCFLSGAPLTPELPPVWWMERSFCRVGTRKPRGPCCPGWRPYSWCSGGPCPMCPSTRRSRGATTVKASPPESASCCSSPTSCASSSGEQQRGRLFISSDFDIYIFILSSFCSSWGTKVLP